MTNMRRRSWTRWLCLLLIREVAFWIWLKSRKRRKERKGRKIKTSKESAWPFVEEKSNLLSSPARKSYPNRKTWATRPEAQSAFPPRSSRLLHADLLVEMVQTLGTSSKCAFTRELSISTALRLSSRKSPSSGSMLVLMSISLSGSSEDVRESEKRVHVVLAFQAFVDDYYATKRRVNYYC